MAGGKLRRMAWLGGPPVNISNNHIAIYSLLLPLICTSRRRSHTTQEFGNAS